MPPSVEAITVTGAPVSRSTTHAEVELARDVAALLDTDAADLLALGPVWWVTSVMPSICVGRRRDSSTPRARQP